MNRKFASVANHNQDEQKGLIVSSGEVTFPEGTIELLASAQSLPNMWSEDGPGRETVAVYVQPDGTRHVARNQYAGKDSPDEVVLGRLYLVDSRYQELNNRIDEILGAR